jgi:hypothetical protein
MRDRQQLFSGNRITAPIEAAAVVLGEHLAPSCEGTTGIHELDSCVAQSAPGTHQPRVTQFNRGTIQASSSDASAIASASSPMPAARADAVLHRRGSGNAAGMNKPAPGWGNRLARTPACPHVEIVLVVQSAAVVLLLPSESREADRPSRAPSGPREIRSVRESREQWISARHRARDSRRHLYRGRVPASSGRYSTKTSTSDSPVTPSESLQLTWIS